MLKVNHSICSLWICFANKGFYILVGFNESHILLVFSLFVCNAQHYQVWHLKNPSLSTHVKKIQLWFFKHVVHTRHSCCCCLYELSILSFKIRLGKKRIIFFWLSVDNLPVIYLVLSILCADACSDFLRPTFALNSSHWSMMSCHHWKKMATIISTLHL